SERHDNLDCSSRLRPRIGRRSEHDRTGKQGNARGQIHQSSTTVRFDHVHPLSGLNAGRYREGCLMSLVQALNFSESAVVAVGFEWTWTRSTLAVFGLTCVGGS